MVVLLTGAAEGIGRVHELGRRLVPARRVGSVIVARPGSLPGRRPPAS